MCHYKIIDFLKLECQQTFVYVLKLVSYHPNASAAKIPFRPLFEAPFHVASDSLKNITTKNRKKRRQQQEENKKKIKNRTCELVFLINIFNRKKIYPEFSVCRLMEQIVDQIKCVSQKMKSTTFSLG